MKETTKHSLRPGSVPAAGVRRGTGLSLRAAGLLACILLAASCSKESADEGTDERRVEITPRIGLPAPVSAQGTPVRSVADPSQEMEMWFARSDESAAGVWGGYGAAALKATRAAGTGGQPLTFEPAQFYQINGLNTRMTGWYPGGATAPGDASGKGYYDAAAGTVSWTIDGTQDILTAPLEKGSKTSAMPLIEFGHALAQVQVYVWAETGAAAQWGQLKSVQLPGQSDRCTLTLADVNETAAPVSFTDDGKTSFTVGNATPQDIPEGKDQAAMFGDPVMIAPQDGKDYRLELVLSTVSKGVIKVAAPARAYRAGEAVRLYVRFTTSDVEVEVEGWTQNSGNNPSFEGAYPYVFDGKIIVTQDRYGFASGYAFHGPWTKTPAHSETAWNANASRLNTVATSFEVASADASSSSTWANAASACANYSQSSGAKGSWRLPTVRELKLIYDLKSELTAANLPSRNYYWSATEYSSNDAWLVGFPGGATLNIGKDNKYFVRCVRDAEAKREYPYVKDGNTIVVKDELGQADPEQYPIHEPWTQTPYENYDGPRQYNNYGAMFEVAKENCNSTNMPGIATQPGTTDKYHVNTRGQWCSTYSQEADGSDAGTWRVPTDAEGSLIGRWNEQGKMTALTNLSGKVYINFYRWTDPRRMGYVDLATGNVHGSASEPSDIGLRCVRDL